MTTSEEQYIHYAECCDSLSRAWLILQDLGGTTDQRATIYDAAFRFALIEYAKPYKRSYGTDKRKRDPHKLPQPILPPKDIELHQQILDLRDQVLAHSDLTWKEAVLSARRFNGRPHAVIGGNSPLSLPDIDAVIGLIERTLDIMHVEKSKLLEALAPED